MWVLSLDGEDPLEKEMAIHSRTIAWKIPWTEDPRHILFWLQYLLRLHNPQEAHFCLACC